MSSAFVIIIIIALAKGDLGVKPFNQAVVSGADQVDFYCQGRANSVEVLRWHHIDPDGQITLIADGEYVTDENKYLISGDHIEGHYNLHVRAIGLEDAGTYRCAWSDTFAYAQLVVLGEDPKNLFTTNATQSGLVEDNIVVYTCEIPYKGLWPPLVEWYDSSGDQLSSNISSDLESTWHQLRLVLQHTDNGRSISTITRFDPPPGDLIDPSWDHNMDQPDFVEVFFFEDMDVSYRARDVTVNDEKDQYVVGETIVCTARGRPSPDIYWRNNENDVIISDSSVLQVSTDMIGPMFASCVASNFLSGAIWVADKTMNFTVISSVSTTPLITMPPSTVNRGPPLGISYPAWVAPMLLMAYRA